MKLRRMGRTNLEVSELAFGGGYVGGLLLHQDDETKRTAVRRALQAGINWIDTAPSYGDGQSEQALGWLLKDVGQTPYVSTKVRIDLNGDRDIVGQVERSLHASLERLARPNVDLLQLHNPIGGAADRGALSLDDVLGPGGAADGLERVRDQGLTRFVGLTALGDAAACREALASGRDNGRTVQVIHLGEAE